MGENMPGTKLCFWGTSRVKRELHPVLSFFNTSVCRPEGNRQTAFKICTAACGDLVFDFEVLCCIAKPGFVTWDFVSRFVTYAEPGHQVL